MTDAASTAQVRVADLDIGQPLHDFIVNEALPGSGVDPETFWSGLSQLIHEFGPRNRELLEIRADMQAAIDNWHRERRGQAHDAAEYRALLAEPFGVTLEEDVDLAPILGRSQGGARA